MLDNSSDTAPRYGDLVDRLLWLCPVVGLVAGVTLLWFLGLSWWTALAVAFLVTCPTLIVWLVVGRLGRRSNKRKIEG